MQYQPVWVVIKSHTVLRHNKQQKATNKSDIWHCFDVAFIAQGNLNKILTTFEDHDSAKTSRLFVV